MQISRRKSRYGKSYGLVPDYFADSVTDIDFRELKRLGIRYIALDVDQTLGHNHASELTPDVTKFLTDQVAAGRIEGIAIASNSFRDLTKIAGTLDAQIVRASVLVRKPRKCYYARLLSLMGCSPNEIAMVGDRLLTDILGGNRSGLTTVLVRPSGPELLIDKLVLRQFWGKQYLRRHRGRTANRSTIEVR